MNYTQAEEFKQIKGWCEIQGEDVYNTPWAKKVNTSQLWFQWSWKYSIFKQKNRSFGWHSHGFFCIKRTTGGQLQSFEWNLRWKKTTTVIKLYSCDINPASLLNIHYKIKVLKKHQTLFFDTGERCSFVRANNHQRTDCLRSPQPSQWLRIYIRLKY